MIYINLLFIFLISFVYFVNLVLFFDNIIHINYFCYLLYNLIV